MAVTVYKSGVKRFAAQIGNARVFSGSGADLFIGSDRLYSATRDEHRPGRGARGIHGADAPVQQSVFLYASHAVHLNISPAEDEDKGFPPGIAAGPRIDAAAPKAPTERATRGSNSVYTPDSPAKCVLLAIDMPALIYKDKFHSY